MIFLTDANYKVVISTADINVNYAVSRISKYITYISY